MNFKPNPLLYGASEDFYSSFKLAITMSEPVDHAALSEAVAKAMPRYPYFSVQVEKEGNSILLAHNSRPVPVLDSGRCLVLGSEACNGHLLFLHLLKCTDPMLTMLTHYTKMLTPQLLV